MCSVLERHATKNPFDALALVDIISLQSADDLCHYERVTTGHQAVAFPSAARTILSSEFSASRRAGCTRLNGTLPDCPDYDAPPQKTKNDKPAAVFGEEEAKKAATLKKEKPKNEDRLKTVLRRIKARFESASDVGFSFYSWTVLSAATVPWKMLLFDEIHPSGFWTLGGYDLSRDDYLGLVCYLAARRWGARHAVVCRMADKFALAAMAPPQEYAYSPGAPEELRLVTDPAAYSVYSGDPLWVCEPQMVEMYVRYLKSVADCKEGT